MNLETEDEARERLLRIGIPEPDVDAILSTVRKKEQAAKRDPSQKRKWYADTRRTLDPKAVKASGF
jgi:hypothetical protein